MLIRHFFGRFRNQMWKRQSNGKWIHNQYWSNWNLICVSVNFGTFFFFAITGCITDTSFSLREMRRQTSGHLFRIKVILFRISRGINAETQCRYSHQNWNASCELCRHFNRFLLCSVSFFIGFCCCCWCLDRCHWSVVYKNTSFNWCRFPLIRILSSHSIWQKISQRKRICE